MHVKTSVKLKNRLRQLKSSPTLEINERSAQLIKQGKDVFKFGFGQSPFPVPAAIVKALEENAFRKEYLPVQGLPKLREEIADFYMRKSALSFSPDHIHIGPGSKELIYHILLALDATLLLPMPSWVSYAPQALLAETKTKWIETSFKNDWKVTSESLDAACSENPADSFVLILNYPSNPVGHVYSASELKQIAEVCRKHEIIVIADEIYHDFYFDKPLTSLASFMPELTIVTSGLSKWCGAGGWRLGYALVPDALIDLSDLLVKIASETFTSASTPVQYAAVTAFQSGVPGIEEYKQNCRSILSLIADYTTSRLTSMDVQCAKSFGGFYVYPDFTNLLSERYSSSSQMCKALLEETGVALLPGEAFGHPSHFLTARLSFVDFDGAAALEEPPHITQDREDWISSHAPRIKDGLDLIENWT